MRGELSKKRWGDPIRQLEFDVMDNAHPEAVLSYRLEESCRDRRPIVPGGRRKAVFRSTQVVVRQRVTFFSNSPTPGVGGKNSAVRRIVVTSFPKATCVEFDRSDRAEIGWIFGPKIEL